MHFSSSPAMCLLVIKRAVQLLGGESIGHALNCAGDLQNESEEERNAHCCSAGDF